MLMGLVRNNLSAGRAVAYFLMRLVATVACIVLCEHEGVVIDRTINLPISFTYRCHLTSTEVLQSYRKGGAETDESTNLHFISEQVCYYAPWRLSCGFLEHSCR